MTEKVFYYHYNKPASAKAGKPQLSVHYDKKCQIVDGLVCAVPTFSHINKRQPKVVMKGRGVVTVTDGIAHISSSGNLRSQRIK